MPDLVHRKTRRALMRNAVAHRIVAILALTLAGTQPASSQLPPAAGTPPGENFAPAVTGDNYRLKSNVDLVLVEAMVRD
jgi:hypothetical protein